MEPNTFSAGWSRTRSLLLLIADFLHATLIDDRSSRHSPSTRAYAHARMRNPPRVWSRFQTYVCNGSLIPRSRTFHTASDKSLGRPGYKASAMVQLCNGATVQLCNGATVQLCNGAIVQRCNCNGATAL